MQGFAVDRQIAPSSLGHRLHPLARRGMYEIHAGAARASQADHAIEGELLGELGMHQVHVPSFGATLGSELFVIELDQVVILGMHNHDAVVFRHLLHRELDSAHIQPQPDALGMRRDRVRGENLEAWKTLLNYIDYLIEYAERKSAPQTHMQCG